MKDLKPMIRRFLDERFTQHFESNMIAERLSSIHAYSGLVWSRKLYHVSDSKYYLALCLNDCLREQQVKYIRQSV